MSAVLGVKGGLSVDHLVAEGLGAQFDQLGGPGLFGALGGRLVDTVDVRLAADLPTDDERFTELFTRLQVNTSWCAQTERVTRLWILNSSEGRRIVETGAPGVVEIEAPSAEAGDEGQQVSYPGFWSGLDALLDSSPLTRPGVASGTEVGIDPHQVPMQRDGIAYLQRVTPPGGVVLPSRVQLSLIDPDAGVAARRIATELQTPVIARLDRAGMLVIDGSHQWTVVDQNVRVHETTGAGDSSAAAIMAAVALGADLVTAAMFGASVARFALAGWGAAGLLEADPITSPLNGVTSTQER